MSRRNTKQSDNRLFVDGERLFKKVMFLEDKGFKNILVTAPLESGKTSFVYDYLLGAGKKVAILSNRSLLKDQNKKYVKRTQAQKNKNESNNREIIDNTLIYCYQIIGNILFETDKDKRRKFKNNFKKRTGLSQQLVDEYFRRTEEFVEKDIKEVDYLILDEAHYFTSDSEFNDNTEKEFEYLFSHCNGVKVFMTATPEAFIEAVRAYEEKNKIEHFERMKEVDLLKQLTPGIQDLIDNCDSEYMTIPEENDNIIQHVNNHLIFNYIHEKDKDKFISEQVKLSNPYNKMIYFANNKRYALIVKGMADGKSLLDKKYKGGAFLCSLYDTDGFSRFIDHEERERIVDNEKFNKDVLVTTKVLDNGINIRDRQVKRVIIDYVNYDSVVQMIGRIRTKNRTDKEKLEITLIVPELGDIKNKIRDSQRAINGEEAKKNNSGEDSEPNLFRIEQCRYTKKAYEELLKFDSLDGENIFNYHFGHIYTLLTHSDNTVLLPPVRGLDKVEEEFKREEDRIESEKRIQAVLREQENEEERKLLAQRIQSCFAKYGNRELLKDEFDMLAKDLNFKNKDGSISKTANKINDHLAEHGYRVESRISREKNTRDKKTYRIVKRC
ncbi:DEAD/DEAH box helicase [Aedoeadaptatus acetigenes]|uniref:DEAD/DEAH box helicase n=1 Tax=Aedoeadaptatus acetigenes TaxID=2981723 RepID=UPI0011DCF0F5|nr:DEAD/DEAH box helicase [Aedoeadaptatus acetigenes]MCU6786303.1 helicase-related protein [Aedoeadaptatus acetigenes]